jgi:hypothetical protein
VAQIDGHALGQAELELAGGQRPAATAPQPRHGRAQVGARAALGDVGPERPGHRGSMDHATAQGEVDEQAL